LGFCIDDAREEGAVSGVIFALSRPLGSGNGLVSPEIGKVRPSTNFGGFAVSQGLKKPKQLNLDLNAS
jgi:hypothetical protein